MSELKNAIEFSKLRVGDQATVVSLSKDHPSYRKKLLSMGVLPGTNFKVVRIAPFGDPIEIRLRGFSLSLRKEEANLVSITRAGE